MKRILAALFIIVLFSSPALAVKTSYPLGTVDGKYAHWRNFPGTMQIASYQSLKGIDSMKDGDIVFLRGGLQAADGDQGNFIYDASSTAPEDGKDVIKPTNGTGAWVRMSNTGGFLGNLENNEVWGKKTKMMAGEPILQSMGLSAYYIKKSDFEETPRIYQYKAGNEPAHIDNQTYAPVGIICMDDLPADQGDMVTVTVPGEPWVFRRDAENTQPIWYGTNYYIGYNGRWTISPSASLDGDGDRVVDFGTVIDENTIAFNAGYTVLIRQADGTLSLQTPPDVAVNPLTILKAYYEATATGGTACNGVLPGTHFIIEFDGPATDGGNVDFASLSTGVTPEGGTNSFPCPVAGGCTLTLESGDGTDTWRIDGMDVCPNDNAVLNYAPASPSATDLQSFTDFPITTDLIGTDSPPRIVSVTYTPDLTQIEVTFDRAVKKGPNYPDPEASGSPWRMTLDVDGNIYDSDNAPGNLHIPTPTYVSGDGSSTITLEAVDIQSTDVPTLYYTAPGFISAGTDANEVATTADIQVSVPSGGGGTAGGGGGVVGITEFWYMTKDGSGQNAGSSGAWADLPDTEADAMSLNNFNNAANWDTADNPNKIDPNDVVYIKGTGWNFGIDIIPVHGITIDGNGPDVYTPVLTGPNTSADGPTLMNGARFLVYKDHVTIRDLNFTNVSAGGHVATTDLRSSDPVHGTTSDYLKVSHLTIQNNYFDNTKDLGEGIKRSGMVLRFVPDLLLKNNLVIGNNDCGAGQQEDNTADFFAIAGGARIKIYNNRVEGTHHALFFQTNYNTNENSGGTPQFDIPPFEGYRIDPDFHLVDMEIAYNSFGDHCAEGLTYDGAEEVKLGPGIDADVIASKNGNVVTLTSNNWGSTNYETDFSGFYAMSYDTANIDNFGAMSLIEAHDGKNFTLADATEFTVGQKMAIALAAHQNWVHHNRWDIDADSGYPTRIYVENLSGTGLFENNFTGPGNANTKYKGILFQSLKKRRYQYHATDTAHTFHTARHIARYNVMGRIKDGGLCQDTRWCAGTWDYDKGYNNSIYNNLIWDVSTEKIGIQKRVTYAVNNKFLAAQNDTDLYIVDPNGTRDTTNDRTTMVPGEVYAVHPPNILSTNVSGTTLTVTFNKPVDGCTSGDCGFSIRKNGGYTPTSLEGEAVSIDNASGSGNTRTFTIGSLSGATSAFLFYNGNGGITSNNVKMIESTAVGHDLLTTF